MKTKNYEIIRLNIFSHVIRCILTERVVFKGSKRKCKSEIYIFQEQLNVFMDENKSTLENALYIIDRQDVLLEDERFAEHERRNIEFVEETDFADHPDLPF